MCLKTTNNICHLFSITDSVFILLFYYFPYLQVREFFTGQRTRVRRFIRLASEKASRSNACKEELEGPLSSDPHMIIDSVPLNTVCPTNNEEPSCSTQDEVLPDMNDLDKRFVDNIFILMRKEEKFSGQVKLMEWILQIQNAAVLHWYVLCHYDVTVCFSVGCLFN